MAPEGEAITQLQDDPIMTLSESIDASHTIVEPKETHNESLFEQEALDNDNPIEQAIH